MLLSNTVTQKSTETLLSPLCSVHNTMRYPRFSKHSSGAAHHSWVTELSCELSNHENLIANISLFAKSVLTDNSVFLAAQHVKRRDSDTKDV